MTERLIRTFIAIPLAEETRRQLAALVEPLRKKTVAVKWVRPENIHLTLRFLGELKPNRLRDVLTAFPSFLPETPCAPFTITHLGAFPSIPRPRVIWAGITEGTEWLIALAGAIEAGLCRLGFPKDDKPFSPHITIGRVRSPRDLTTLAEFLPATRLEPPLRQDVNEIIVYQSTLTPQGPDYQALLTVSLTD